MREFRALWAGELLSAAGDQLSRLALAVLVYLETSSAALAAVAYAVTLLPAVLGGVLLGGLAGRYPRRELIAGIGLARALLAGLLALGLPLPLVYVLAGLLALGAGPARLARRGLAPDTRGRRGLRAAAVEAAQVAGVLAGGALLALADPRLALGVTAVTYAGAALAVLLGVRHRPAEPDLTPATHEVAAVVWRDRSARGPLLLCCLAGLFLLPAGLAAAYGHDLGLAVAAVGVLMAATPTGGAVGAWLATRTPGGHGPAPMGTLAVAAGLPLAACLLDPPLPVVLALWAAAGACTIGYLSLAQARLAGTVPEQYRTGVSELARAGVLTSLGVAVLGAGVLADATSPASAVGAGGVTGAVLTALVVVSLVRRRRRGDTDQDLGLTTPTNASVLPPPMGEVNAAGDGVLTTPTTASRLPPSVESAAERGNGLAGVSARLTTPTNASLSPPSGGVAAEHGNGADQVRLARSHKSGSLSTGGRSRIPARWALWGEPVRLLVLILLVEAVSATVTGFLAWDNEIGRADLVTLGTIIGLGLGIGELTRNVERVRRRFNDTPHVNLTSVWSFSAVLALPPVLVPAVIGTLYLHLFWRSRYRVRSVHAYRLVFTASTVALGAYLASGVRHWLAPADMADWNNPVAILAVVLAALAYAGVNWGLIVIAITLHERRLSMRKAFGTGREAALEFGTIGLGAINALLISIHPLWALMMVPALLVLHRSVLMRQLEEAASTDQKTGLANATAWTNMASAEIQRAQRDDTQVGVLMVDLDHFKQVNDTHGHLVGDRVLQAVADALTACARRYDVVGRWGGEEFVVLCPEVTADDLRQIGERVCERVRGLRVPLGEHGPGAVEGLSVSVGLASYPEFGPELQDVLLAADDALFVAKDSGRNQVQTIIAAIGDLSAPRAPSPGS
ncbi:MAG TPA: diguanylate cyclase [Actinophytocola sp.]|nr:diguanylate cyclase [Actinophytocola sp.]